MRWIRLSSVALCVLLAGIGGAMAAEVPRIEFPQTQHTFAPVVEGETVMYEFEVRNQGDAELEIYAVRSG